VTWVKICGITSLSDARAAVVAGADAVGFVLAESPRRVDVSDVREITRELPDAVEKVGVFVNAEIDAVMRIVEEAGLTMVQFHGDESPDYCERFKIPIIKRFNVCETDTADSVAERAARYRVRACMLDPGCGTGESFRWELGRDVRAPLVVAGGLDSGNVVEAMRQLRPFGVDVSSGVERSPGVKDVGRIEAFVEAVRREDANRATR
jgi:phosphoribosylanthranilate isomerase